MGSWNGMIATLTKGESGGAYLTGRSTTPVLAQVPHKFMKRAQFAITTAGISGAFAAFIVSRIGGATFVVAGATGIASNTSVLIGTTPSIAGVARPSYVAFESAKNVTGFTASIFMAGDY